MTNSTHGSTKTAALRGNYLLRISLLLIFVLLELLLVSFFYDAYSPQLLESGRWYSVLSYAGDFSKSLVVMLVVFLLFCWPRAGHIKEEFTVAVSTYSFKPMVLLQLAAFGAFFLCSGLVFDANDSQAELSSLIVCVWFALLIVMVYTWLLTIAPLSFWKGLVKDEFLALSVSLAVGVLAWGMSKYSQTLWGPLSELTFICSAFLLGLSFPEIVVDAENRLLGTMDFVVNIAPVCSGYEGIALVVIFTALYLRVFKEEFKFPQSILLFPIGIITIWTFNVLRIVLLISIGSSLSEDIAIGGFHSQAGWIAFIVVSIGLLILAHKSSFFAKGGIRNSDREIANDSEIAFALMVPFLVLLSTIILTVAFSGEFIWLYPFRVLCVGGALFFFWNRFELTHFVLSIRPILVGIVVFIVWVFLVLGSAEDDLSFARALDAAPSWLGTFWLIFRFIGAVLIIPVVEELMFRGYLLSRLSGKEIQLEGPLEFSWQGLLLSTLLFAALHSNFTAGAIAGLCYGLLRYKGNSVFDAIIAHLVTNLCLSLFVLYTGFWSVW